MVQERRHNRKEWNYPGRIACEPDDIPCLISDISESGARIQVSKAAELPTSFMLYFGETAMVKRNCVVRWRKEDEMGVQFPDRIFF